MPSVARRVPGSERDLILPTPTNPYDWSQTSVEQAPANESTLLIRGDARLMISINNRTIITRLGFGPDDAKPQTATHNFRSASEAVTHYQALIAANLSDGWAISAAGWTGARVAELSSGDINQLRELSLSRRRHRQLRTTPASEAAQQIRRALLAAAGSRTPVETPDTPSVDQVVEYAQARLAQARSAEPVAEQPASAPSKKDKSPVNPLQKLGGKRKLHRDE